MMNTQNANQNRGAELAAEALNTLIKDLEAGKSEALQNYLNVMARFHQYSWNNCLLIAYSVREQHASQAFSQLKRLLAEKVQEVDFFKGALQKSRLDAGRAKALARRHL